MGEKGLDLVGIGWGSDWFWNLNWSLGGEQGREGKNGCVGGRGGEVG